MQELLGNKFPLEVKFNAKTSKELVDLVSIFLPISLSLMLCLMSCYGIGAKAKVEKQKLMKTFVNLVLFSSIFCLIRTK